MLMHAGQVCSRTLVAIGTVITFCNCISFLVFAVLLEQFTIFTLISQLFYAHEQLSRQKSSFGQRCNGLLERRNVLIDILSISTVQSCQSSARRTIQGFDY